MSKELVTNLVTPPPEWWDVVIDGMRNAFKSWDNGDSEVASCEDGLEFVLGKNDKNLLLSLVKAGDPSHRKVLRQLPVIMDISAPLYWWKQMDTYKVGTTASSESTMHTLVKRPFKLSDFSLSGHWDHGCRVNAISHCEIDSLELGDIYVSMSMQGFEHTMIQMLNQLRSAYKMTNDKSYWNKINELLPQSYIQKRTWSANYEVLLTIIKNRLGHTLPIWDELITYWLENVERLLDLACAAGLVVVRNGTVMYPDKDKPGTFHELYKVDQDGI